MQSAGGHGDAESFRAAALRRPCALAGWARHRGSHGAMLIAAQALEDTRLVHAAFTTRRGGVSGGVYRSLNLAFPHLRREVLHWVEQLAEYAKTNDAGKATTATVEMIEANRRTLLNDVFIDHGGRRIARPQRLPPRTAPS